MKWVAFADEKPPANLWVAGWKADKSGWWTVKLHPDGRLFISGLNGSRKVSEFSHWMRVEPPEGE